MPPLPVPPATARARLWEVGAQAGLTGAFVGGFAWWWATTHGSAETKVEGVHRGDPLKEGGSPGPRPSAESAAARVAKATGYIDAGVESGEEAAQGVFKNRDAAKQAVK